MVFSTLSDPFLIAAFWTGTAALGITSLLAVQIVCLRLVLRRNERRTKLSLAKWRPILNETVTSGVPRDLPVLPANERIAFLGLWVYMHQSLRGEAGAALNEIARMLGCDVMARKLLAGGNRQEKLLAILVSGCLRDDVAWPLLSSLVERNDRTISAQAFWALVQINAEQAAQRLLPTVILREDWALSQLSAILQGAERALSPRLIEILRDMDIAGTPRALRLAEVMRVTLPSDLLHRLLHSESIAVLLGALRVSNTPDTRERVRRLAEHDDWQVRVQAVKALGRIGSQEDVALLVRLLGDRQWWVRYRAAHALADLPFLGREQLLRLGEGEAGDRFAADIMKQVLAERKLA